MIKASLGFLLILVALESAYLPAQSLEQTKESAQKSLSAQQIRIRFLKSQAVKSPQQSLFFTAKPNDLKRRFILNLSNPQGLSHLQIKLNGRIQALLSDAHGSVCSFELSQNLKVGENQLEISQLQPGKTELFLDGYLDPIDIPGAFFTRIPAGIKQARDSNYVKGILQLKFLEGMRIRVIQENNGFAFIDLNGTDLSRLNRALKHLGVRTYFQPLAYGQTPEEMEAQELDREMSLHTQEANPNLFFTLGMDEKLDMWAVHDEILELPYFEEVYLRFEPVIPRRVSE